MILKPCPFCLEEKFLQIHSDGGIQSFKVYCHNCKCSKPAPYNNDTKDGAIESWNTRVVIEK